MLPALLLLLGLVLQGLAKEPRDVSRELESLRAEYELPACAAAVIEHGQLSAIGAAGLRRADRNTPVTIEDSWHLGSCTKSLTALVAAVLVDQGKVRWETPVPEAIRGIPCDPAWQRVTIWDLVTHRSGLGQVWFPENSRVITGIAPREQRENFARSLLSRAPASAPGVSAYSNAGYALLGAILEHVSGDDYQHLLRALVFTPLGLASAGFGPPAASGRLEQPWGHRREGKRLVPIDPASGQADFPPALAPAACVHMSLQDFVRFASWYCGNEPRLVTPETFARLRTPPKGGSTYAGGVWKTELPGIGEEAVCHTGQLGGFFAVFYASRDCACVTVFNREGRGWEWLGDEIMGAVLKTIR